MQDEARSWLAEAGCWNLSAASLVKKLKKSLSSERARLIAEQLSLREKAVEKFGPLSQEMFFSDRALQQATDLAVARHKASRFTADIEVHDYCCGIGGDLLALARRGPVLGLDQDPVITLFAEANLRACQLESSAKMINGVAEEHSPQDQAFWHIDPDRRVNDRRSTRPEWHSPSEKTINEWLTNAPNGAIKYAPAAKLKLDWQQRAELEWISRGRSCRQLVAWFGCLAEARGMRRATAVEEYGTELRVSSYLGDPHMQAPTAKKIGDYVFDTDPAIRAANLTDSLSTSLGCESVSPNGYLTKDSPVDHSLISCFQVNDVHPFRVPKLSKHLQSLGIGQLEIKTRGVSVNPDVLRKQLKLTGELTATLLITRQGKKEIAIVARRCD